MFYWFAQIICGILARLLFRLEVSGGENVPSCGPFILASNHSSYLDPVIIAVSINRKLRFIAKKEIFSNKLFAALLRKLNVVGLRREGIDRAALKQGLESLRSGRGLLIFPEGTRSLDGRLQQAKGGISIFAFGSTVPVVPAFIKGSWSAMPPGSNIIKPVKIKVFFSSPVFADCNIKGQDKTSHYQDFANRLMDEIADLEKRSH